MALRVLFSLLVVGAWSSMPFAHGHLKRPDESDFSNRVVLIRHAEKGFVVETSSVALSSNTTEDIPRSRWSWWPRRPRGPGGLPGRDGKFPNGLSNKGKERAQFIRTLFGKESDFDFGLIFAAPYDAVTKDTERTYATVAPLAEDLGLEINIKCANAEPDCILEHVKAFARNSTADILICWKHFYLNSIATALGANNAHSIYPDDRRVAPSDIPTPRLIRRNDVIWIMEDGEIREKRSMHCPVLDDGRDDEGDPDLVVEEPGQTWLQRLWGLRAVFWMLT